MRFFDETFKDINYRMKVLKMFPEEFRKGYLLYKQGKLYNEDNRATAGWGTEGTLNERHCLLVDGWYPLEAGNAVKFNFSNGD